MPGRQSVLLQNLVKRLDAEDGEEAWIGLGQVFEAFDHHAEHNEEAQPRAGVLKWKRYRGPAFALGDQVGLREWQLRPRGDG
jgi:hypothetical protein